MERKQQKPLVIVDVRADEYFDGKLIPGAIRMIPSWDSQQRRTDMSMKDVYEKKLEAKLNEWNADIDKLKAKADSAEADAQLEYYKQIEDLRSQQEAARKKLDELKGASNDAWEDLKAGIDSAWDSLSRSIKSAVSRFG